MYNAFKAGIRYASRCKPKTKAYKEISMLSSRQSPIQFQTRSICQYLPDHRPSLSDHMIFAPSVDPALYGSLISHGWRRYGRELYRMACPGCNICIPLRINAEKIRLSSSLKKILRLNSDLQIVVKPPSFNAEHFELWKSYSKLKHFSGPGDLTEEVYCGLFEPWSLILEYREMAAQNRLVAVSHIDPLPDGISSVYFSFAPEAKDRSLGFFSIMAEAYIAASAAHLLKGKFVSIETEAVVSYYSNRENACKNSGWYYLGFWVPGSPKMEYKARISPFEIALPEWHEFGSRLEALEYLRDVRMPGLGPSLQI